MPLNPGNNEYFHLEIEREPRQERERRRSRRGFSGSVAPPDSRSQHGQELEQQFGVAIQQVSQIRRSQGIDPSQLLVLEFSSIDANLREDLEKRFRLWIVDERKEKNDGKDYYRFLIQFPDEQAQQDLEAEINLYQNEIEERGILTPRQRRNFLDGLQQLRPLSPEERLGNRLRQEGFPEAETFYLDLDLWHPGNNDAARQILNNIRAICQQYEGQFAESVRTSSLLLAKVRGSRQLAEALLELDLVARVDLPPRLSKAYSDIFRDIEPPDPNTTLPSEDDPLVCVIDSGVVSGHPFLMNWVVEERDFDSGEDTPVDRNGHGTAVAGLVVYGDVARCI